MVAFDPDNDDFEFLPAYSDMAEKLAVNRTGRLTGGQRRILLGTGSVALVFLLCPMIFLVQIGIMVAGEGADVLTTLAGGGFVFFGLLMVLVFVILIGSNAHTFLSDALRKQPVRYARGELRVHMSEKNRPELPFSYIVDDYSFAPYTQPADLPMKVGSPYLVYYARHSRILLSIAALEAPDADQWKPEF
ncbi:MAG: hypothetical protein GYB65_12715 [Chloroflexi bacterium]|nr:hypothetical protein [Chloroflexota bacterium]